MARAEGWLLDPAPARAMAEELRAPAAPVLAVVGLARRCGATTVARAVAVELARRSPGGAAFVSSPDLPRAALATAAARRLARSAGPRARAAGRLAIVRADAPELRSLALARDAPVLLDVAHGTPPEAALALADRALVVASPDVEPALAAVVAAALDCAGARPLVVLNRAGDGGEWSEAPDFCIGESRIGARLAASGREPPGALGALACSLADACCGAAARA